MGIYALGELIPHIHPDAFVHPDCTVIGAVTIGAEASIWPAAVPRADYGRIEIGERAELDCQGAPGARDSALAVPGCAAIKGRADVLAPKAKEER